MSKPEQFYDLLFEISNEHRHNILLVLKEQTFRSSELAKKTGLNNPEIRRHISRLIENNLIQRDVDGYYYITPYGSASLILFHEIQFLAKNNEYFKNHDLTGLPDSFLKQIGKLMKTRLILDTMDFIRHIQNLLKDSEKQVWMLVDKYPINLLPSIIESIDRGISVNIIESSQQELIPDFSELTSEESRALILTKTTPLYEQRNMNDIQLQLFLSESKCIVCFPNDKGEFDYIGLLSEDDASLTWCKDLFEHYWNEATSIKKEQPELTITRDLKTEYGEFILVEGSDDPHIDVQAVQNAVDNFKEVVLKGVFNLGNSEISISKSVIIRGDGRENAIPVTKMYKKGWRFPFHNWTSIFSIDGKGVEVEIKNIHFKDFNCAAIHGTDSMQKSVRILNNRITLPNGYGRGIVFGNFGDFVHGILIEDVEDGVLVEGNYVDFATGGLNRGMISRGGLEDDPEYRPNLFNHEYFASFGIVVNRCSGRIVIKNNIVKNFNARGITSAGNYALAEVIVRDNNIESEVYGSYPFSSRESCAGILVSTTMTSKNRPSFDVQIEYNRINLMKLNQSGIVILGPLVESSSKLRGGVIRDNVIYLKNGYEGIHLRKCDAFSVSGNQVSGEAYYGIRISGSRIYGDIDMGSIENSVNENDLKELKIKDPDNYVLNHLDGKMFTKTGPKTSKYWLGRYSKKNKIGLLKTETLIDEGKDNELRINLK